MVASLNVPDFYKKFVLDTVESDQGIWTMLANGGHSGERLKHLLHFSSVL